MKKKYTLRLLLEKINSELGKRNIRERKSESDFFLAYLYGCTRPELYLHLEEQVPEEKILFCQEFIKQRRKRLPLPYFLGETEFMGLKFFLQPGVFIPRQETEILVEETIKAVNSLRSKVSAKGGSAPGGKRERKIDILDLGTGSGNIAISLAKFLLEVRIVASDISLEALEIAQKNAYLHNLEKQIIFLQGNLFEPLTTFPISTYDIIVSNPPYISKNDLPNLEKELFYEPKEALFAGDSGLEYYQKIIPEARKFLKPEGYLLVEIGYGQKEKVKNIFISSGFKEIKVVKDYSGIERVVIGSGYSTTGRRS